MIEIRTSKLPSTALPGSAGGLKVEADIPFVAGLDKFMGDKLSLSRRERFFLGLLSFTQKAGNSVAATGFSTNGAFRRGYK